MTPITALSANPTRAALAVEKSDALKSARFSYIARNTALGAGNTYGRICRPFTAHSVSSAAQTKTSTGGRNDRVKRAAGLREVMPFLRAPERRAARDSRAQTQARHAARFAARVAARSRDRSPSAP